MQVKNIVLRGLSKLVFCMYFWGWWEGCGIAPRFFCCWNNTVNLFLPLTLQYFWSCTQDNCEFTRLLRNIRLPWENKRLGNVHPSEFTHWCVFQATRSRLSESENFLPLEGRKTMHITSKASAAKVATPKTVFSHVYIEYRKFDTSLVPTEEWEDFCRALAPTSSPLQSLWLCSTDLAVIAGAFPVLLKQMFLQHILSHFPILTHTGKQHSPTNPPNNRKLWQYSAPAAPASW